MNKKHESLVDSNLYYCFVNINKDNHKFRFFLLHSKIVSEYVRKEHQLWRKADKSHKKTDMRQFRLGFKKEKYKIPTPSIEDFEDNWELKWIPQLAVVSRASQCQLTPKGLRKKND